MPFDFDSFWQKQLFSLNFFKSNFIFVLVIKMLHLKLLNSILNLQLINKYDYHLLDT
jgi:hypothetical protein